MELHNLKRSTWLQNKGKRLWRWNGSGKWNYSWKWHKWQKARTWYSKTPGFEWWQTSLLMRRPKSKWFKRYYKLVDEYSVLNLSDLQDDKRILEWTVNKQILKDLWYIKKTTLNVKILWNWEFTKSLNFDWIDSFSKTAITKIEKAWWKILDKKSA